MTFAGNSILNEIIQFLFHSRYWWFSLLVYPGAIEEWSWSYGQVFFPHFTSEAQGEKHSGQAMYEQTVKVLIAFDKQHSTIVMLTSWSFSRAKPNGKKHKLLRSGWPAAVPHRATSRLSFRSTMAARGKHFVFHVFCRIHAGNWSYDQF